MKNELKMTKSDKSYYTVGNVIYPYFAFRNLGDK